MPADPRAAYRVQLHADFTLDDAAAQLDYIDALGASHLYSSPYLQAAPDRSSGYAVVDPHRIDVALGGEEALERLREALEGLGMGELLDVVPNHMAAAAEQNPWWWDLLENGPASRYATYFDIEWDPPRKPHSHVVVVPILDDHYGRVLEAGEIQLDFRQDRFVVRVYAHTLPIEPRSAGRLLAAAEHHSDTLAFLASAFKELPRASATDRASSRERSRHTAVLYDLLARLIEEAPRIAENIRSVIAEVNADPDALDELLEQQNYRLAYWRVTRRDLDYRRFFDINSLIGLRIQDEEVFRDVHARILAWLDAGRLEALRVDHPDGMRDPAQYLHRLRSAAPEAWILVEKILAEGEELREDWPIDGTTGYDFLNRITRVLVDPRGEAPLTEFYTRFTGLSADYAALVREKKLQAATEVLGSDLRRLTSLFKRVCEHHRRMRDYLRPELRRALTETAAALPVYRTYVAVDSTTSTPQVHAEDERYVEEAIAAARANSPELDAELFDFLRDLLLLRIPGNLEYELALRFQQFSGPVMAKGVEDSAFYVYNRFVALNEVGGDPAQFSLPVEAFHQASMETLGNWPYTLLTTSTHDTKRSGDVRARLAVLSERPHAWIEAVTRWAEQNERHRRDGWPDRNTEYLIYQTLVGAWPISEKRVQRYVEKACREAKTHTNWTDPDTAYEDAVAGFVTALFADADFTADLAAFVETLVAPGQTNALAQTLVKLTAPGVPDVYQGCELWELSLADPDNRRPVDFARRRQLLDELEALDPEDAPEQVLARADEGLPKLWVIRQALRLRRRAPQLFGPQAGYRPLPAADDFALAFIRSNSALTIVPRLGNGTTEETWETATVVLPPGRWRNLMTGEWVDGGAITLGRLLARFPVALLVDEALGEEL